MANTCVPLDVIRVILHYFVDSPFSLLPCRLVSKRWKELVSALPIRIAQDQYNSQTAVGKLLRIFPGLSSLDLVAKPGDRNGVAPPSSLEVLPTLTVLTHFKCVYPLPFEAHNLPSFKKLRSLKLFFESWKNLETYLPLVTTLHSLHLWCVPTTAIETLAPLSHSLVNLKLKLDCLDPGDAISDAVLSDAQVDLLCKFKALRSLELYQRSFCGRSVIPLSHLERLGKELPLTRLGIDHSKITREVTDALWHFPHLTEFSLGIYNLIDSADIDELSRLSSRLTNLKKIKGMGHSYSTETWDQIFGFTNLRKISANHSISPSISRLRNLEKLSVCNLDSETIPSVALLTNLRSLKMYNPGTASSIGSFQCLSSLQKVESVKIAALRAFGDEDVSGAVSHWTSLRCLKLKQTQSISQFSSLSALNRLHSLTLIECTGISDTALASLFIHCRESLRSVTMKDVIFDGSCLAFAPQIESLEIQFCDGTVLSEKGFEAFRLLSSLRTLSITGETLFPLPQTCPNLSSLSLPVCDAHIFKCLSRYKKLSAVHILAWGTGFSASYSNFLELISELPRLNLLSTRTELEKKQEKDLKRRGISYQQLSRYRKTYNMAEIIM